MQGLCRMCVLTDVLCIPARSTNMGATAGSMVDIVLVEGDGVRRAGEDETPVVVACGEISVGRWKAEPV